ncbi:MAG: pyrimidine-nucleoside phosphorylase [Lachnospiraceae bacterium]|nr:pyrimidine-nucleoside phosphorylase [Lachnospiraceae bacterium]
MRMYDLILKKKQGGELTREEIDWMIQGYTKGDIPDYQMSAMTMAICFNGMNDRETGDLTLSMRDSGDTVDLSSIDGVKVDKHSTGGVGDKTSIALLPLVSSLGVKLAKMSGRGLGHTGGTIDKLESIPGFKTEISMDAFISQVNNIGMAIMGQTADLAPADKKLYALRDVTATVDQMSLIASSIMSKKLAAGADAIVLDVKCGSGAFMKELDDAKALADAMVRIGRHAGKNCRAVITNMDEPLGRAVGNAIEVREAIDTLKGKGPEDFTKLVLTLGSRMVVCAGLAKDTAEAEEELKKAIDDGSALEQLKRFITAQGGDASCVDDPEILKTAEGVLELKAQADGYVQHIDCDEVGMCSLVLGGGREKKSDIIDPEVGIYLYKKVGDSISKDETMAVLYYNDKEKGLAALERLKAAYHTGTERISPRELIIGEVD